MKYVTFNLNEETGVWEYLDMKIYMLKNSRCKLLIGKQLKAFSSIYDVLDELYRHEYCATFQLPMNMENLPSGVGELREQSC